MSSSVNGPRSIDSIRSRKEARSRARKARLRAFQFGTDGKREWILRHPSVLSGQWPVDPAHVLGTRGAGHGAEGLCPLTRAEHRDFDGSMTDERFRRRHGHGREWVREAARQLEREWQAWQNDLAF